MSLQSERYFNSTLTSKARAAALDESNNVPPQNVFMIMEQRMTERIDQYDRRI